MYFEVDTGAAPTNDTIPTNTTTIISTESVAIVTNEANQDSSQTIIQSQSSSQRTTQVNSSNEKLSGQKDRGIKTKKTKESHSETTVTISVDPPSSNPLYDEIHYV